MSDIKEKDGSCISFDRLTIEEVANAHERLLEAFSTQSEVSLDIAALEDIDIAGVQIILAAQKESEKKNIPFSLKGQIPEVVSNFLESMSISFEGITISSQEAPDA